jgi:hypothetical protein
MFLIYSIGKARARHEIILPSVFCAGGGEWSLSCGGADLEAGRDYLIAGEVQVLEDKPFLVIDRLVPVFSLNYFAKAFGVAKKGGGIEGGLRISGEGEFAGDIVAVDKGTLILRNYGERTGTPNPSPASSQVCSEGNLDQRESEQGDQIREGKEVAKEGSEKSADHKKVEKTSQRAVEEENKTETKTDQGRPTPNDPYENVKEEAGEAAPKKGRTSKGGGEEKKMSSEDEENLKGEKSKESGSGVSQVSQSGAGEGCLVEGTVISVLSKADQPFPESTALPELAGLKRSELARKADARKNTSAGSRKPEVEKGLVSSSGMRLGKDLGGDKKPSLGQNKIDEDELW